MNKLILIFLLFSLACSNNRNVQDETTQDTLSTNAVPLSDSDSTSHYKANSKHDEADDVTNDFFEGYLMEGGTKDSITLKLDGNADNTKLYGRRYKGKFLFEGDILIDYPDTSALGIAEGITTMSRKWPKKNGMLIIPYTISPAFPDPGRVETAMNMWSKGVGVIFRKRTLSDPHSVFFVEVSEGCFVNQVGRAGGEQSISLSKDCKAGNVAHEIGHVLGLYHEQSRSDRDQYVSIDMKQAGGRASQYKFARDNDPIGQPMDMGKYDFNSIMHYPEKSYFRVKSPYRANLDPGIPGQRDSLSRGDIEAIKSIYSLQ